MEATGIAQSGADNQSQSTLSQTAPLHQYAPNVQSTGQSTLTSTPIISAGIFGLVVAGTGAMGSNLHKVQSGDMSMGEALGNSLARGAAGGAAAAGATAAATSLTSGGLFGLAVTLAAATGISYVLSK